MPFTNSNDYTTGRKPAVYPAGSENVTVKYEMAVPTGDLALNNFGYIGILPAGCIPVEVRVYATDVDSGAAAAVFEVGVLDAAGTAFSAASADGGASWGNTGAAVATAFDKSLTRTLNSMATVTAASTDRRIGVKVATAPTTAVAGTIGVELTYRSI